MVSVPTVPLDSVPDPLPEGVTVLDVREPDEWVHGHIDGAVHIPLRQLPERVSELPEGPLLVICKLGGRSAQAVAYLQQLGRDATNVEGGMADWAAGGRPMIRDPAAGPGEPQIV